MALSGDGKRLATVSQDLNVRVWDTATGATMREITGLAGLAGRIGLSADGSRVVVEKYDDDTVRIWDVGSGRAALVHEAWLRLAGSSVEWNDRGHFLRTAARAMRRILVDHARARLAARCDGTQRRVPLDPALDLAIAAPLPSARLSTRTCPGWPHRSPTTRGWSSSVSSPA